MFCVVTVVRKFDFRTAIKETPKKWPPVFVKTMHRAVVQTLMFLT
jgi:hypothetical protein